MEFRVCELFAGVGGFRRGLENAGWEVVWSNQWEPHSKIQHASNCYVYNYSHENHSNQDIADVEARTIPDHDLLVGGFPCQDYSVAVSKAKGIRGKRGILFQEITRILGVKKPPFVLLENVDRLLRSPSRFHGKKAPPRLRGRDFGLILWELNKLGYDVEWRVVNAADYAFPQRRKRVFILAFLRTSPLGVQFRSSGDPRSWVLEQGFFAKTFRLKPPTVKDKRRTTAEPVALKADRMKVYRRFTLHFKNAGVMSERKIWTLPVEAESKSIARLGDFLDEKVDESFVLDRKSRPAWDHLKGKKTMERVAEDGWRYIRTEGAVGFPDSLDLPSRTIVTTEGGKSPNRMTHVIEMDDHRLRVLTPTEVERLNGFKADWTRYELVTEDGKDRVVPMPLRCRYFCMGNSLVVGLVKMMGDHLKARIESLEKVEQELSSNPAATRHA